MHRLRLHLILVSALLTTGACNLDTRDATQGAFGEDGMTPPAAGEGDTDEPEASETTDGAAGADTWYPSTTGGSGAEPAADTGYETGSDADASTGGLPGATTLPGMTAGPATGCYGHVDEAGCEADGCEWTIIEGAGGFCAEPGDFGTGGGELCDLLDEQFCEQLGCSWDGVACGSSATGESTGEASTSSAR